MASEKFRMELPYVTQDLPGVDGKIRERNDHFIVEEVPLYEPSGEGEHLYVNITREGMTTREIQEKLAEVFDVEVEGVGCAGMKDKYARATQTFSVGIGKMESESLEDVEEKITENLPVTVNWLQMHTNKLRAGHLLGNRFTIKITNLKDELIVALERARVIADRIKEKGLPNFYGPQRFGLNGENVSKGFEIIQGNYSVDDKWLRRLLISSYQSYLCNRYLAKRLESKLFDKILRGDVAKKYDTGGLFEVEDPAAEQSRYEEKEISFTAPIYGSNMMEATGPSGEMEAEVLKEFGITIEKLSSAGANGTRRLGRVMVSDLELRGVEDGLVVKFFLPKGAFATTVLREIMKKDL
ncbi:MAG: tRNA pseudouridine(13) synthase TruD [Candidatus Aenigmatarchaeota archaeon]|nr:MAG: tRNA pseudouridine(13) synthase TruD [Candidatus Aenigmarchaeota archaeon]